MTSFIDTRVKGGVGEILLNRPGALNALDTTMIRDLYLTLVDWQSDDAVHTVLVRSASPKAFCAGGDIRAVREAAIAGDRDSVYRYFSDEYGLNQLIADYPKPYVTLIDGVNMGGGLGISVHGSHRVVTENAVFAMPETAIGFIPDVGASHFLPPLGGTGLYLALTGVRLSAGDALELGLATHFVAADSLDKFAELIVTDGLSTALASLDDKPQDSAIAAIRADIDEAFAGYDVPEIILRLETGSEPWRVAARDAIAAASPWALSVTAELLRRGAEASSLSECLGRELRAAVKMARCRDFDEGVRAMLVDKDRSPSWSPNTLSEVSVEAVQDVFDSPV